MTICHTHGFESQYEECPECRKEREEDSRPASGSAWAISIDEEHYGSLWYDTKEAAIEEGVALYDGEVFYVGRIEDPIQPEDAFDAEDWLEHLSCQDDYMGDHAEDWDGSTKPLRAELTTEVRKVMAAWLDRHDLRPTHYSIRDAERVEPNA